MVVRQPCSAFHASLPRRQNIAFVFHAVQIKSIGPVILFYLIQYETPLLIKTVSRLRSPDCNSPDAGDGFEFFEPELKQTSAQGFSLPGGMNDVPADLSRRVMIRKIDSPAPHDFPTCFQHIIKLSSDPDIHSDPLPLPWQSTRAYSAGSDSSPFFCRQAYIL